MGLASVVIGTVAVRGRSVTVSEAITASYAKSRDPGWLRWKRTKYLSSVDHVLA